jgi:hypothetical protein
MTQMEMQLAVDTAWAGLRNRRLTWDERRAHLDELIQLDAVSDDCPLPTDYAYDGARMALQITTFKREWPVGDGRDVPQSEGVRAERDPPLQGGESGPGATSGSTTEERSRDSMSPAQRFDLNAGYRDLEGMYPRSRIARLGYHDGKIYAYGRDLAGQTSLYACLCTLPLGEGCSFTWHDEDVTKNLPRAVLVALDGDDLFGDLSAGPVDMAQGNELDERLGRADDAPVGPTSGGKSEASEGASQPPRAGEPTSQQPADAPASTEQSGEGSQREPTCDTQDHSPEGPNA